MPKVNPLTNIYNHDNFKIPTHFSDDLTESYLDQLKKKFTDIISFLKSINSSHYEPILKDDFISQINGFQKGLIEVIGEYLDGKPSKAYLLFSNLLDEYEISDKIASLQQVRIPRHTPLFRILPHLNPLLKAENGKMGLIKYKQPLDLFHPPFQGRRSVPTNRFSISGYPCIYLSERIETSFSECFSDNKFKPFHSICYRNVRPLYFLDLSEDKFNQFFTLFGGISARGSSIDIVRLLNSIDIYQLVIACHTKINYVPRFKDEKYYFKAEYILPQLLLQWLKLKGVVVDGIRYKSCTGLSKFPSISNHYNYVLPVKESLNSGFCPTLLRLFQSTDVYSYLVEPVTSTNKTLLKKISGELLRSDYKELV